jgi:hypothetical protein
MVHHSSSTWSRWLLPQRAAQALLPAFAAFAPAELPLPNAGFDSSLAGWTVVAPAESVAHAILPGTGEGVARMRVGGAVSASLGVAVAVGSAGDAIAWSPQAGDPGERPRFGARVQVGPGTDGGSVVVEVLALSAGVERSMARTEVRLRRLAAGRWVWVDARPLAGERLRSGDQAILVRVSVEGSAGATSQIFVDQCAARLDEAQLESLGDPGFEEPLGPGSAWESWGVVFASDPGLAADDWTGTRHVVFGGTGSAGVRQSLPLYQTAGGLAIGSHAEAGVWVRVEPGARLGRVGEKSKRVELRLKARRGRGARTLGKLSWLPTLKDCGVWRYVEVTGARALRAADQELIFEVEKSFVGELSVDAAQVGSAGGVHGHPQRLVGCNYVGRYASEVWGVTGPGTPGLQWRNWRWTTGTPCDLGWDELDHDPDCAGNPDCMRASGRRDAAISELGGANMLPLAGTYDSRDPAIARFHVRLASAIGIDHFVFDHLGHTLAEQSRANGMDALNEDSYEVLLDAVDAEDGGFRVAIMYEPKVHFSGWITGEDTLQARRAGVVRDLVHFAQTYGRRRAMLRHDGQLVVYVFRNAMQWGGGGMDTAAWLEARREVEHKTGERLFLVADNIPGAESAFGGISKWNLVERDCLQYRTFGDIRHQTPSWPEPQVSALEAHAAGVVGSARAWAWSEAENRIAAAVVWPGFDDSGVAGWGSENLIGEDGLPLCVRVTDSLGGAFFATTQSAALAVRPDWIQVATWNDWNELTQIEPAWHPNLEEQLLSGSLSPGVLEHCFGRALEAQAMVSVFRAVATDLEPQDLVDAAARYLEEVRSDPLVLAYD